MDKNKKYFWKNFIVLVMIFSILLIVVIYNLRIGFSVFDWSEATISGMFILNGVIVFFSIPLIVFALFYRKKKKNKK